MSLDCKSVLFGKFSSSHRI